MNNLHLLKKRRKIPFDIKQHLQNELMEERERHFKIREERDRPNPESKARKEREASELNEMLKHKISSRDFRPDEYRDGTFLIVLGQDLRNYEYVVTGCRFAELCGKDLYSDPSKFY